MFHYSTILASLAIIAQSSFGELVRDTIRYEAGDVQAKSLLIYDSAVRGLRPGVVVVPEFWGLNDFAFTQAERLAALGYVALAADMYGNGVVTTDRKEAALWAGKVRGTPQMSLRVQAAFNALRTQMIVDTNRIAAIGFCFGGTAVLELAYSGAKLGGVVSFHGGLRVPSKAEIGQIRAGILILHGSSDPTVPRDTIARLIRVLDSAKTDYQLIEYSGAKHAFTNPKAVDNGQGSSGYHPVAAKRSWNHMRLYFTELFGEKASFEANRKR